MDNVSAREFFSRLKIGDAVFKNLLGAVKSGNNTVESSVISEAIRADTAWIDEVDGLLCSVEAIVKDPKSSIKEEELIVNIEKAKRVTANSMRHLAAHTYYISKIEEDGTIKPSKIKTMMLDEDLHIYENRFVYTLVHRLHSFIEQKYEYLARYSESVETVKLDYKSDFKIKDLDVDFDLQIKLRKPGEQKNINEEALEKLKKIKRRLQILTGTDFYNKMSKAKLLTPPIAKTNLIKMNVDYNNCYKLWLFLHSFVNTGYGVKVSQTQLPSDQDYIEDLCYLVAIGVKTMLQNDSAKFISELKQYEVQPEKAFIVRRDLNYVPDYKGFEMKDVSDDDYLNQYYYEKIKEILTHQTTFEENTAKVKEDFVFAFYGFYRQLAKINEEIFEELLLYQLENDMKEKTAPELKMKVRLQQLKELYNRRSYLNNLKKIDYLTGVKKEQLLLARIKKMQYQLNKLSDEKRDLLEEGEKIEVKSVGKKGKNRREIINEIKTVDGEISEKILVFSDDDNAETENANTVSAEADTDNTEAGIADNTETDNAGNSETDSE